MQTLKKAWKFVCDQWLFFIAAVGTIASLFLLRKSDMSEELAQSKKESDEDRAEKDEAQRELINTFQERMREIDRDIEQKDGQITAEKEEQIREVVDSLKQEMTEDEVISLLKEVAPEFKYIPASAFGEIDE